MSADNLKFCYDDTVPVNLKLRGGSSESDVWPWLYEIRGYTSEGDYFCTANLIRRDLLVTGKI